jgi:hypothetical protein
MKLDNFEVISLKDNTCTIFITGNELDSWDKIQKIIDEQHITETYPFVKV